jgi:hypothetical protein
MLLHVYSDTAYADVVLVDGTHVFSILDPIPVPQGFTMQVRLLNAWLPHTYYSIFDGNDMLVLHYDDGGEIPGQPVTIKLPRGNRSIDNIVKSLNNGLLDEYVVSYDENTNKLSLLRGTENAEHHVVIGEDTTCTRLLGLSVGDYAQIVDGKLLPTASRVVDLTRTSSVLVHINLLTQNREPRTRRVGDILAKTPSSAQFNGIDHFSSDAFVDVFNRYLSYISLRLSDDDGRTFDLNGGRFTATLKIAFIKSNNEPIPASIGATAPQRSPGGGGGPQPGRIAVPGASGPRDGGGDGKYPAGHGHRWC